MTRGSCLLKTKAKKRTLLSQEKILSLSCYTIVCKAFLSSTLYAENPEVVYPDKAEYHWFYVGIQQYYAFSLSFLMRTGQLLLQEKLKCDLSFHTEQPWQSLEKRSVSSIVNIEWLDNFSPEVAWRIVINQNLVSTIIACSGLVSFNFIANYQMALDFPLDFSRNIVSRSFSFAYTIRQERNINSRCQKDTWLCL